MKTIALLIGLIVAIAVFFIAAEMGWLYFNPFHYMHFPGK